MSGYGDEIAASRKLEQVFKFFDSNGSGYIDYDEFFAAMVRLNFVGVQVRRRAGWGSNTRTCHGPTDMTLIGLAFYSAGNRKSLRSV
jgi:hypothetical protein